MDLPTALRSFPAFILAVAVHAVFACVLHSARERQTSAFRGKPSNTVLLLVRAAAEPPQPATRLPRQSKRSDETGVRPSKQSSSTRSEVNPTSEVASPPIDWTLEAEQSAAVIAAQAPSPGKPDCKPNVPKHRRDPRCAQADTDFDWAAPRTGLTNGLPYIRFSESCALIVGFVACKIGKKPAEGDLFEHMRDPERDRSSVPPPE